MKNGVAHIRAGSTRDLGVRRCGCAPWTKLNLPCYTHCGTCDPRGLPHKEVDGWHPRRSTSTVRSGSSDNLTLCWTSRPCGPPKGSKTSSAPYMVYRGICMYGAGALQDQTHVFLVLKLPTQSARDLICMGKWAVPILAKCILGLC